MESLVPIIAEMVVPTSQNQRPRTLTVKERDERFMQIQEAIQSKREFLNDNQKRLRVISKQNRFLDGVKNDYQKYHSYIRKQKNEQIEALKLLDTYIQDLTTSGKLSALNMEDAKVEQSNILRELDNIKRDLDSMVDDDNVFQQK